MMTPTKALILCATCGGVLALCWVVVGAMTNDWRGIAAGVVLATCAGGFIWFAATDAHAAARGLIALGIAAFTAPWAGLSAMWNELLYLILRDDAESAARLAAFDSVQVWGFTMALCGTAAGIVAVAVGWVWHVRAGRVSEGQSPPVAPRC